MGIEELGDGLDEPLLVKGKLALFHMHDGTYAFCYKGLGILKTWWE